MAQTQDITAKRPPLTSDDDGTVRVGETRITLDVLLTEYNAGNTPEQTVDGYDTLKIGDVYSVIAYYLQNKEDVDKYLLRRIKEADKLRQEMEATHPTSHLRAMLQERKAKVGM